MLHLNQLNPIWRIKKTKKGADATAALFQIKDTLPLCSSQLLRLLLDHNYVTNPIYLGMRLFLELLFKHRLLDYTVN